MNSRRPVLPEAMTAPPQGDGWLWYHVILTVYGAWLYGDRRGFRTRHHREHIAGDYRNPPPVEKYADREKRSRDSLKQPPVELPPAWRGIIGTALVERFATLGGFVLCCAVGRQHAHLLTKLPHGEGRSWSGVAKRHAWFVAREHGWRTRLWGKRGKELSVRDREHHRNVFEYILQHEQERAWVWRWTRDGGEVVFDPVEGA